MRIGAHVVDTTAPQIQTLLRSGFTPDTEASFDVIAELADAMLEAGEEKL